MRFLTALIVAVGLSMAAIPAAAQGRGHGNGGGHGNGPGDKPHPTAPAKHDGDAENPKEHGNPHATKPEGHGDSHTTTATTTTTVTTTTVTSTTPTTKHANDQLGMRLRSLLPAGTDINQAAAGFRNWGQFVAAVHASNNLNIPFAQLKARMTSTNPMSLGQAIQSLRTAPVAGTTTTRSTTTTTTTTTTVRRDVERAENEAAEDFRAARTVTHR